MVRCCGVATGSIGEVQQEAADDPNRYHQQREAARLKNESVGSLHLGSGGYDTLQDEFVSASSLIYLWSILFLIALKIDLFILCLQLAVWGVDKFSRVRRVTRTSMGLKLCTSSRGNSHFLGEPSKLGKICELILLLADFQFDLYQLVKFLIHVFVFFVGFVDVHYIHSEVSFSTLM